MKTVYEVTKEDEYTGELNTLYKGGNKREAQAAKRSNPEATYRSYYAADKPAPMATTCHMCSHYARLNCQPEPHFHAWEVDQSSGLCLTIHANQEDED